jgi:3-hydroxyisobutyrate dehydrogenase
MVEMIKVGWIGTGVMGKHQAMHLINAGYKLSVYNRTASKAQDLIERGALFKSPKEIAEESDYLFLMLGYPHDV